MNGAFLGATRGILSCCPFHLLAKVATTQGDPPSGEGGYDTGDPPSGDGGYDEVHFNFL